MGPSRPGLPGPRASQEPPAGLLLGRDGTNQDPAPPPRLALLTVPQEVISGQEGFSWDWLPVLRPWLQAHVDPFPGSPAVKLLIVEHLEESSRRQEETAQPSGA